ncbi:hypothetical protein CHLNCDRAFT_139935 [Chlorella variabilis]|uniref:RRM domain-containing protein n=1 Tax=Chlorella variabilis TaxID=554065 RepID=E1ZR87_CHLVA|nr:hypothetical protein CHLNCDRAFT_139935 [Chlorella variabilis]EFN51690.1 hypothetical protein CHLNCDRAFT_139935 [Chlorella variabilis]|eukprot:XP_005843792.1 hypothetical protein CHLNCDRAFT_139935 [Chlorella variabilis]
MAYYAPPGGMAYQAPGAMAYQAPAGMAYPAPGAMAYAAPPGGPSRDPHISPQFTAPTKVIHLRNLPFDVTLEEIREFCAPWGTIVGGNRNQAFVEFATLEQAMAIVSHYQSSPEPAKFRGRSSWLSFSGRDRLTNVTPSTDSPTPVLQVNVINIQPDLAQAVTLDLLNSVFGAHGFVKKLVTYAKPEGGVVAWVQFPDAQTAATVRNTLQGQPIPRHLLNDHPNPPVLDMAFAAQPDLAIRAQSYCTRDYTNAAIPWGEPDLSMIQAMLPSSGGTDGPSNVLSVSFDQMTYPVTVDGVHTIFSTYGFVQKIHIFERDGRTVALVQYADVATADSARAALEGHAMYDGGHNVVG